MSVYLIVEIRIQDETRYAQYVEKVPAVVQRFGGRYLSRGGTITPLAGGWNPERIILVEFESLAQIRQCFASPEYLELAHLRKGSTVSRAIVVDGCAPPA